jgi:hypothetical protein
MVNRTDAAFGSLTKLTADEEFSLTFNENGVKIYEAKLYWEFISTYGDELAEKELSWNGESVSAKLVPSVTLFLKLTTK